MSHWTSQHRRALLGITALMLCADGAPADEPPKPVATMLGVVEAIAPRLERLPVATPLMANRPERLPRARVASAPEPPSDAPKPLPVPPGSVEPQSPSDAPPHMPPSAAPRSVAPPAAPYVPAWPAIKGPPQPPPQVGQPPRIEPGPMMPPAPQVGSPNPFGLSNGWPPTAPLVPDGLTLADVRLLALANNREIAVLGFAPRINGAIVDGAAGVFNPAVGVRSGMGTSFQQVSTQIQSFGSTSDTLKTDSWGPLNGPNQVYVEKGFVTGGRAEVGMGTNYSNLDPLGNFVIFNPAWQASLNFAFEQPLFRNRGPVATMAPIRIAQANQEQSSLAFQAQVNQIIRDVDLAYWSAYATRREVANRERTVRTAAEIVERQQERLRIGIGSIPDLAQSQEQYEDYRAALIDAQNRLAATERELRRLLGLHPGDHRPLSTLQIKPLEQVQIDFGAAVQQAMQRPDLGAQRKFIEAAEVDLARSNNGLQHDLSVRVDHSRLGLDDRLDQAFDSFGSGRFNTWTAGLVYRRQLGQPIEQAAAQRAALALAREQAKLRELEHRIRYELDAAYQNVIDAQRLMEATRKRREAAEVQLDARRALYEDRRATMLEQLDAVNRYHAALNYETAALLTFQQALTHWNYARGALLSDYAEFVDGSQPPSTPGPTGPSPAAQPTLAPPPMTGFTPVSAFPAQGAMTR